MLLLTHIIIALTGLVLSSFAVFSPSVSKIKYSAGFVAATIASGTILVITTHSPLVSSCVTGLAYTAITFGLLSAANRRLAKEKFRSKL